MTALMWAAYGGHFEVTKVLIDAGAAIEANNTEVKQYPYSHMCVCVCVCVDNFILPSYCMI